jgi:hypothetical protein
MITKDKRFNPQTLFSLGLILAIQAPALLLAQTDEGDTTLEISISIEDCAYPHFPTTDRLF